MIRHRLRIILPALFLLIASCNPGYLNHRKNDLHIAPETRALNQNLQTESFLMPILAQGTEDRPQAKFVPHARLSLRARHGILRLDLADVPGSNDRSIWAGGGIPARPCGVRRRAGHRVPQCEVARGRT